MENKTTMLRFSIVNIDNEILGRLIQTCITLNFDFACNTNNNASLCIIATKQLFKYNVEKYMVMSKDKRAELMEYIENNGVEVTGNMTLSYLCEIKLI